MIKVSNGMAAKNGERDRRKPVAACSDGFSGATKEAD
jgi:hypothetical protein